MGYMFDELSLLEADSIDDIVASAPESASSSTPVADFTASLDYIDSLANRRAISLSRRDVGAITTAVSQYDYLSPSLKSKAVPSLDDLSSSLTDFRPLQDRRLFHPQGVDARPAGLVSSASEVVSNVPSSRNAFPPHWRNPLDPTRSPADIERALGSAERRNTRHPFAFRKPDQTVICLKRKIRRMVMHASGFAGGFGFRYPRRSFWSRVIC